MNRQVGYAVRNMERGSAWPQAAGKLPAFLVVNGQKVGTAYPTEVELW